MMRSKLFNLVCLVLAVSAAAWISLELFRTATGALQAGQVSTATALGMALDVAILAGLGFIIVVMRRYPDRQRAIEQMLKRSRQNPPVAAPSVPRVASGVEVMEAEIDKITTLVADDIDFSLPDYLTHDYDDRGRPIANARATSFHSLDVVKEAALLARVGQNDRAIEILSRAFAQSFGPHDRIALTLLNILDDEIESESTSASRLKMLYRKRDRFLKSLPLERGKLSDETWLKIHVRHPISTEENYFYPEIYRETASGF